MTADSWTSSPTACRQDLALYASFHLEGQVRRLLVRSGFTIERLEARDTVYPFPKQRIVALARKAARGGSAPA